MTKEERNNKLKYLITCMKCGVSGKCGQNCLVQTQIGVLLTYKRIIHNLPDGYPLPFEK